MAVSEKKLISRITTAGWREIMSRKFSLRFFYKNKARAVFFSSVFAFLAVVTLIITIITSSGGINSGNGKNTPPYKTPNKGSSDYYATVNMGAEPITLNSMKATDPASKNILRHVKEGLVRLDKDGKPIPAAAESWESSNNNLTWTFKLRENLYWTDGSKVTADDFVFAFKNILMGNGAAQYQEQMKIFRNAENYLSGDADLENVGFRAADERTLVITLEKPRPDLLYILADTQFSPVKKDFYEKYADKYGTEPYTISYNGPWYVREWHHSERTVLVKNPLYWNRNSIQLEQVLFISSGTTESKVFRLQMGDYDYVYVPAFDLAAFIEEGLEPVSYNDGAVVYLEFNTSDSAMSSIHLRKALAYGIDREKFAKEVLGNGASAAYSLVNPKAFYDDLGDFDIKKSYFSEYTKTKDLLAEAKAELALAKKELNKNQLDSIRITVDESPASVAYANALAAQWKENLGLTVKVESLSYSDRVTKIQNNDYQVLINFWDISSPSLENVLGLFDSGNNFSNYDSGKFSQLLKDIRAESRPANKNSLIEEAFALLREDLPLAPLYYRSKSFISTGRVKDIVTDAYRDIDLYFAYC